MTNNLEALEKSLAQAWDMPDVMIDAIENPRLPFTESLGKIVGQTVTEHVTGGAIY